MSRTYGTIARVGDRWRIDCEPHVRIRMKRVFHKVQAQGAAIFLHDTVEHAYELDWFCRRYPMRMTDGDRLELEARVARYTERQTAVERILHDSSYAAPMFADLAMPARQYQRQAADMLLRSGHLLLGDDVGLGKTVSAICALSDRRALPAMVVTMTHLPGQWRDEIARFAPSLRTHILRKGTPYDLCAGRRGRREPFPDVIITNYHKLAGGWADALAGTVRAVVFDEVQELRHAESNKYRAATHLAHAAAYRLGLSATPIYNYGGEIYNVLSVLAPDVLGTRSEFVAEWCNGDLDKPRVADPRAMGTYLREHGLLLRRTRQDVGRELPALTTVPHYIDADLAGIESLSSSIAELARTILEQNLAGIDRMRASSELDWRMRQATGIAKAPYVAEFVRMLVESGERVVLYGWHHECFARGTSILMADGTITPVEDVMVGDVVMGPDSLPRKVLSLVRGRGNLYRVQPRKGESWVCSENHILTLRCSEKNRRPYVTMRVSDYLRLSPRSQRSYMLYRAPVIDFGGADVVEPWLVGYWLGDGNSLLTTLCVSTSDNEVVNELEKIVQRHGLRLRVNPNRGGCAFYSLTSGARKGVYRSNALLTHFQNLNLNRNKHIPYAYKTAPITSRLELLAGLLDSDGHVFHGNGSGSAVITTTIPRLADDIVFVCRSLGLAAYISPITRTTAITPKPRQYFRVNISGDLTVIPTRIGRKRAPIRVQRKNVLHTGFDITPAGVGDFYGFEVDGDRLFLLGDYTVVHNCYAIWRERLAEYAPAFYTGRESIAAKNEAKRRFVAGETPILIMSLRSGAGLDGLQGCCRTVVFGELDWSPGVHEQGIGRIHRDGQDEQVFAYFLIAQAGSDPVIADVLGVKRSQIEGMRDPRAELFEVVGDTSNHVRRLAEEVLRRYGNRRS